MGQDELHPLFQQMGEVLSGIRALHDMAELRQAQAEQMQALLRSEIAVLRQDQRELEGKIEYVSLVVQHDVNSLHGQSREHTRSICELAALVARLRKPIDEIVAMKSRVAGLLVGAGFIGSVVLWLAEPVYRWIVDSRLLRH